MRIFTIGNKEPLKVAKVMKLTGKRIETPSGNKLFIITKDWWEQNWFNLEKLPNWHPYDSIVLRCHVFNCGFGILDGKFYLPVDNEFVLEEAYAMLKK